MFLIDTNVISEMRKGQSGKIDKRVAAWARSAQPAASFISAITVLELEIGVLRLERRDPAQGAILRIWLDRSVMPSFAGRVLAIDAPVAREGARLQVPDLCAERDVLIAATAIVHGMTVVTRNERDFAPTGVALLNPWNYDGGQ